MEFKISNQSTIYPKVFIQFLNLSKSFAAEETYIQDLKDTYPS